MFFHGVTFLFFRLTKICQMDENGCKFLPLHLTNCKLRCRKREGKGDSAISPVCRLLSFRAICCVQGDSGGLGVGYVDINSVSIRGYTETELSQHNPVRDHQNHPVLSARSSESHRHHSMQSGTQVSLDEAVCPSQSKCSYSYLCTHEWRFFP